MEPHKVSSCSCLTYTTQDEPSKFRLALTMHFWYAIKSGMCCGFFDARTATRVLKHSTHNMISDTGA